MAGQSWSATPQRHPALQPGAGEADDHPAAPEGPASLIEAAEGELGEIRIANEVVSTIAGLAAVEVEGVAGMSGGIAGGIAEILGRRNLTRGVKVEVGQHQAAVDLYVVVEYGVRIPEVAWKIQENVKHQIEAMTGLEVAEVNVHVQGVHLPASERQEEPRVK